MFDNIKQVFTFVGAAGHGAALGASLFEYQMASSCEEAIDDSKKKYKEDHPKATDAQANAFVDRVLARCKYFQR